MNSLRDFSGGAFFRTHNEIIDRYAHIIGPFGVAVYCALSRRADNGTQEVRLSTRDIAAMLGMSQDRARKSLSELNATGLIRWDIPKRPAPGVISVITLLNVTEPNVTRSVEPHTERHTFSSEAEPNVTRSPYKEEKTKTETKTKKGYDPALGDAIDWRKYCNARKQVQLKLDHGAWMNSDEILREQCVIAGISTARALELEQRMLRANGVSA